GGWGGAGVFGAEGGDGADSLIVDQVSGSTTGLLSLSQSAEGGYGGNSNFRGSRAGDASSSLTYADLDGPLEGNSSAIGGNGGNGIENGIAADGGNATASINLSGAFDVTARADVFGGNGGNGVHAGRGGIATLGTVYASSTGGNVSVTASVGGGNGGGSGLGGGTGLGGDSGNGQAITLNNAIDGDTLGLGNHYLFITQQAFGGYSGDGFNVGNPGSATSILSKTKNVLGQLKVVSEATAGLPGNMYD